MALDENQKARLEELQAKPEAERTADEATELTELESAQE